MPRKKSEDTAKEILNYLRYGNQGSEGAGEDRETWGKDLDLKGLKSSC